MRSIELERLYAHTYHDHDQVHGSSSLPPGSAPRAPFPHAPSPLSVTKTISTAFLYDSLFRDDDLHSVLLHDALLCVSEVRVDGGARPNARGDGVVQVIVGVCCRPK